MQPEYRRSPSGVAQIPPAINRERVVCVASGKGGVGTSVAASLLALSVAGNGARVLLIDGNEGSGALHHLFGVRPSLSLDALRDPAVAVDDVLIRWTEGFALVASRPAHEEQAGISADARRAPFERLLPLTSDFDLIVVDAGARLDNVLAVIDGGAGNVMLVSDADRISLAANYALLKVLSQKVPPARCSVLVNRHDDAIAQAATERLSEACLRFLDFEVAAAGSLPDDACLRAALGAGMPIGDAAEGSPAARAMSAVADRVWPSPVVARALAGGTHSNDSWS